MIRGTASKRDRTGIEHGCSYPNKPIKEVLESCFSQAGMTAVSAADQPNQGNKHKVKVQQEIQLKTT